MDKKTFEKVLEEYVLPLFTGSELMGEEVSSVRDNVVAQGSDGTVLVKPQKNDDYRFIIRRDQPFKGFEVTLIRSVIEEFVNLDKYKIQEEAYNKSLHINALEKAICKSVSEKGYNTLLSILHNLRYWSGRTYEGGGVAFGFLMSPHSKMASEGQKINISDILNEDFSANLSDGITSCFCINQKGDILGYMQLHSYNDSNVYAPYSLIDMAKACKNGRVGISLLPNGDISVFSSQELVFAKTSGEWTSYSHVSIIQKMIDRNHETDLPIKEAMYLSALDVSFNKTGGCIACIKKDLEDEAIKHISSGDILIKKYYDIKLDQELSLFNIIDENDDAETVQTHELQEYDKAILDEKMLKVAALRKIIAGRKFQELDRKFRSEIMAIDGAIVLDYEGNIICVGAIIKIESGSTGGGRLAATKTLANYGVALKISMDGVIQGFNYDNKKQKVRPLFSI